MKIESLVLASQSLYRQQILQQAGLSYLAVAPDNVKEHEFIGKNPAETALMRAEAKAIAVGSQVESAIIIGCDQVMEIDGMAVGKEEGPEGAAARLRSLSGRKHFLHNGLAVIVVGSVDEPMPFAVLCQDVISVQLTMRTLTEDAIAAYVATDEWRGSAGCYKIEGRGALLFSEVSAHSFDIIGLPLNTIAAVLRRRGIDLLTQPAGPWVLQMP